MIKKNRTTRISYGVAMITMAATLSALQAYAEDGVMPSSQTAPTTNSTLIIAPSATVPGIPNTVGVLGTLPPSNDASMAQTPSRPAVVPPVAPIDPSVTAWQQVLPPQQSGNITYVTGGIGDEERAALGEAKKEFNLYVMSSNKDGTFVGDTHISIKNAKGEEVLDTTAGPLLYAKLPTGTYAVEASKGDKTQKEKLTISTKGASNLHFSW